MSNHNPPPIHPHIIHGFDSHYGLEIEVLTSSEVKAKVKVKDHHLQPVGLVHGGVYAAIAESVSSLGTWSGVGENGQIPLGMSNNTSFFRSIESGYIHASATLLHRGRTTWVWDVEMRDDAGKLCAVSRMTIAVRERRTSV